MRPRLLSWKSGTLPAHVPHGSSLVFGGSRRSRKDKAGVMWYMAFLRVLFAVCCAPSCLAQVSSGTLIGDVRDAKAQAVPGARINARSDATSFARSVETTALGGYRIDDLIPGAYTVTAGHDGFRAVTATGLVVELNQKTRYDFALEVASRTEAVTVSAHVSPLQTDEASEGYTLDTDFVRALPLTDRNVIELVTLGPGAIPRQLGGYTHDIMNDLQANRGAVALNPPVNGSRSTGNSYILDGAYNTDRNTFSIAIEPPMESVAEFRIQSSLAPAEFAQSGGAVVDVVTKSGSHSFHGSAFEFFQNEATDAKGFFEVPGLPRGIFRQNDFGASLGGPINRSTFFFATYEGLRGSNASATQHLVPDASVRTGDFTGRNLIYDPLSLNATGLRSPFPNNIIPANRLDPNVQKYLSLYEPLPNQPDSSGSNYLDSTPNQNGNDSGSMRVDHGFNERSRLFARYSINDERTILAGAFPERPTSERLRAQQAALGHTLTGRDWVADTRFSFTRLRVFDLPLSAFGTNVLANLGIQGLSNDPFTYGLPALTVTDFDTVQDSNTLPQLQRDNTWYVSQDFSRTKGRHTWKTGLQFTHFTMAYMQSQYVRGNYQFNGTYTSDPANPNNTGDAFADFLLGLPDLTQRQRWDCAGLLPAERLRGLRAGRLARHTARHLDRGFALRVHGAIYGRSRQPVESGLFDTPQPAGPAPCIQRVLSGLQEFLAACRPGDPAAATVSKPVRHGVSRRLRHLLQPGNRGRKLRPATQRRSEPDQ